MSNKSTSACPACEYERGTPVQPVSRQGEMHCLQCGNSWKELSALLPYTRVLGGGFIASTRREAAIKASLAEVLGEQVSA